MVQAEGQLGGEARWEREAGPWLWARKAVLAVLCYKMICRIFYYKYIIK